MQRSGVEDRQESPLRLWTVATGLSSVGLPPSLPGPSQANSERASLLRECPVRVGPSQRPLGVRFPLPAPGKYSNSHARVDREMIYFTTVPRSTSTFDGTAGLGESSAVT